MIELIKKLDLIWRRRSFRDGVAIAAICVAVYIAANTSNIFDATYAFAKLHQNYEVDDAIMVAIAFGFLMLFYAMRRVQDLKLEIREREKAERKIDDQALQLAMAVNNISQGILLFDSDERLIVCNRHYIEMYNLSPDIVKPGVSLRDILRYRTERGLFNHNTEEYRTELLTQLSQNKVVSRIVETPDGRQIAITNYPTADGGWVATHEDQTEQRRRDGSFRLLFENNPMAMWLFDRETLRFLAVNDAAVVQYGYSREQFLTMSVPDIRAGDEAGSAAYMRALPDAHQNVAQHIRADGARIDVAIYSRVLNYENRQARLVAVNDITARKLAEDDLRRTKMFLDAVIENVPLPIVVKTIKDGRFTLINRASEELHGYRRENIIGKTLYDIFPMERADLITAQDAECLRADQPIVIRDHTISTPHGVRLITSKKVVIASDVGAPEYLLTLIDDVTERREAERRIEHMAHSDPLTDLPNRTAFNECVTVTLNLAEAERRSFAILCMDLDGFKEINDIYGHAVGDALLCQVADRLRAVAGDVFVARLGGDEFTIIADSQVRSTIAQLAERLLAAFVEDFEVDGRRVAQGLSIGIAVYPTHGTDATTLMKNADAALYQAKSERAGSVRFFEAEMEARLRDRSALQSELRSALQHNELQLHYQPQLKMTGEITGFEALARWQSPKRGMIPPGTFIPLAEESSLILQLGEWVLREACREAASWDNPLGIAVNVSPIQFRHGDLPRLVHSILLETGLAANRLELEITEGVLVSDFSRAVSILRRLKGLGVQIALDDFGTGYSSLSYLHSFPFDKIKIDRTFISDLEDNRHSIAIVRAVIGLCRSLNIPIVAEGVETKAQHTFLKQEGCDEVQGYLTGRPLAIADYAAVVGRKEFPAMQARAAAV